MKNLFIIAVFFLSLTNLQAKNIKEIQKNGVAKTNLVTSIQKNTKVNKALSLELKNKNKILSNHLTQKKDKTQIKTTNYDIDKAVRVLNKNARTKTSGYCARYVRLALEGGGLKLQNYPASATNYDAYLPTLGFKEVKEENYLPKKGDISVIKAFKGDKNHPHGHISMYDGKTWISDFRQKDIWAGEDYRKHKPKVIIFRKG